VLIVAQISLQVPLQITPRLVYSPRNFVAHNGVQQILRAFENALSCANFSIFYIHGVARNGKTHLAIKLAELAANSGRYPRLIEGGEMPTWLAERSLNPALSPNEILIFDDSQLYFLGIAPGQSGPWVELVESLRVQAAVIVVVSSVPLSELACDDHVMSRLRSAQCWKIEDPEESELINVIEQIGIQRGIKLSPRKISFLIKRLGRTIPEIERFYERAESLSQVLGRSMVLPVLADAI